VFPVAIVSQKGGVAKSALALHLGDCAEVHGGRAIWKGDLQGDRCAVRDGSQWRGAFPSR